MHAYKEFWGTSEVPKIDFGLHPTFECYASYAVQHKQEIIPIHIHWLHSKIDTDRRDVA